MKYLALILEDQPEDIKVISLVLNSKGFDVVVARTPEEATEKVLTFVPHLLIVDIQLNHTLSGLDWILHIRKLGFGEIPVMVLSGSNDRETIGKALKLGLHDYMIKPIGWDQLKLKLHKLVTEFEKKAPFSWESETPIEMIGNTSGIVSGVSEVGIAVSSFLKNVRPSDVSICNIELFEEIGVAPPLKVTLLNHESETRMRQLGVPFRMYSQVKGWSEGDRKKIRRWLKTKKLQRSL